MTRFYFDVFNGHGEIRDEDGIELDGDGAATRIAIDSIRSMIAEDARRGVIDLQGRIVIRDDRDAVLATVRFADAFLLRVPGDGRR